jgi:HSP20 family protein
MAMSRWTRDDPLSLFASDPFGDFFSTSSMSPWAGGGERGLALPAGRSVVPSLHMDVKETESEFQVACDAPGMMKEDFDISFEDNVLRISCERKEEKKEENERYHISERRWGSSSRAVRLPKTASGENVKAVYDQGVLKIVVPKRPEAETRKSIRVE